jgi:hypothetical protein
MMELRSRLVILGFACAALAGPASAANLLVNGSFETPLLSTLSTNTAYYAHGNTSITGWTVDMRGSPSPYIQLSNNSAFGGLNASEGIQFWDLTGVVGRGGGVRSNPVATSAAFDYVVSFDVGAVFYFGSYGAATIDLLVNGTQVGSYTVLPPGSNSINWQRFSYGFAGTDSPVTIGLYASFDPNSSQYGVGLDNVVLEGAERIVTGVPEPMSWALMTIGFGFVGQVVRRKTVAAQSSAA